MCSTIDYVCKAHRNLRKQEDVSSGNAEDIYYAFKGALKELLDYYCQKYSLRYSSMDMKTKGHRTLGKCTSTDHISFNPALIDYSPDYIRYVVIHELCHTKHHSHRYCFWKLIESCLIAEGLIPPGDYVKREHFARKADNPAISFPIKSNSGQVPYFEKTTAEMFRNVKSKDNIKLLYGN